jgi:hypothetical protein
MRGDFVTLVNRTSQPLTFKANGRTYRLQPGANAVTNELVRFAKLQLPRMGTFDPSGLQGDYLVGVKGVDDCSMIPPGEEHKGNKVERFDRSQMDDEAAQAVVLSTGIQQPRRRVPSEAGGVGPDVAFGNHSR